MRERERRRRAAALGPAIGALGPALVLAVGGVLAGCSTEATGADEYRPGSILADVVFLTLSEAPAATMDGLYEGDVVLTDDGCLRLAAADSATVVWPHGFTLTPSIEGLEVRDDRGRFAGWIGGRFQLGGGEVAELHDGIPVTSADRERARADCPGRYWIASPLH